MYTTKLSNKKFTEEQLPAEKRAERDAAAASEQLEALQAELRAEGAADAWDREAAGYKLNRKGRVA